MLLGDGLLTANIINGTDEFFKHPSPPTPTQKKKRYFMILEAGRGAYYPRKENSGLGKSHSLFAGCCTPSPKTTVGRLSSIRGLKELEKRAQEKEKERERTEGPAMPFFSFALGRCKSACYECKQSRIGILHLAHGSWWVMGKKFLKLSGLQLHVRKYKSFSIAGIGSPGGYIIGDSGDDDHT